MRLKDIDPSAEYEHQDIWEYVYERDCGICQLCGKQGTEQHHIKMKSAGGKDEANNLVLLCKMCHTGNGHSFSKSQVALMKYKVVKNERKFRRRLI